MRNNKTWFSWSTSFHYFRLKYNNLETKLTVSSRKNKWQRFPFQMVLIKESSPLQYIKTKVRWRFRQILWPSQNTWTLMQATWFCFYLPDIRSLIRSEKGYNRILLINFRIRDAGRTRGALVPPPPIFLNFPPSLNNRCETDWMRICAGPPRSRKNECLLPNLKFLVIYIA